MIRPQTVAVLVLAIAGASVSAQKPPAVRQLGRLERVSSDSLASAAAALPMPGGRVLVNDITARRVLLFDSTLAHATVVADTTSATANAYGSRPGTLIRYRGDTAIHVDIGSMAMWSSVRRGRSFASWRRRLATRNGSSAAFSAAPGFDARGRIVYFGGGGVGTGGISLCCLGSIPDERLGTEFVGTSDSSFVVRTDLATRTVSTRRRRSGFRK